MTLANFNSNFNWQLRMLKEAAECCGIVPDLPPGPPPPSTCFYFINLLDNNCISFADNLTSWTLNGYTYWDDWGSMMGQPPYSGGGWQFNDPNGGCYYSNYWFWTIQTTTPPNLVGNDSSNNPVDLGFTQICTTKCYSGVVDSKATVYMYWINTTEWADDGIIFLDITDPLAAGNLTAWIDYKYGTGAACFITDLGGGLYEVKFTGIYSNGTKMIITMVDSTQFELAEITC